MTKPIQILSIRPSAISEFWHGQSCSVSTLIIVPSADHRRWITSQVMMRSSDGATIPQVTTLDDLLTRSVSEGLTTTNGLNKCIIEQAIRHSASPQSAPPTIGTINEIHHLILDSVAYNVPIRDCFKRLSQDPSVIDRFEAISNTYWQRKNELLIHDSWSEFRRQSADQFSDITAEVQGRSCLFWGFWDPTPMHKELIRHIISVAESTIVAISDVEHSGNDEFRRWLGTVGDVHDTQVGETLTPPVAVACGCDSVLSETTTMMSRVRQLVLEGEIPHEMCIVVPNSGYQDRVAESLNEAQVPIATIPPRPLSQTPAGLRVSEAIIESQNPRELFAQFCHRIHESQTQYPDLEWESITQVLDQVARLVESTSVFDEWASLVRLVLRSTTDQQTPWNPGGVTIVTKEQAYMITGKFVWMMGLVEKAWPDTGVELGAMSNQARVELGLPGIDRYFHRDHFHACAVVAQARESVHLSWPERTDQGPTLPSSLIDEIDARLPFSDAPEMSTMSCFRDWQLEAGRTRQGQDTWESVQTTLPLDQKTVAYRWEVQRHITKQVPHYFGELTSSDIMSKLHAELNPKTYSATLLEQVQGCPYYYFIDRVLKESGIPSPEAEFAKEKGIFLHELMRQTFAQVKEGAKSFTGGSKWERVMTQIAESLWSKMATVSPEWAQYRHKVFGTPETLGLIQSFCQSAETFFGELTVVDLESEIEWTTPHDQGEIRLKGTLDALMSDPEHGGAIIVDFKTGSTVPTGPAAESFATLQLPIYQLMAKHVTRTPILGAALFLLNKTEDIKAKVLLVTPEGQSVPLLKARQQALADATYDRRLIEHIARLQSCVQKGQFSVCDPSHPTLRAAQCRRCPVKQVCRYPERHHA